MKICEVPEFKISGPTPFKDEHGVELYGFGVNALGFEYSTLSFTLDKKLNIHSETKNFVALQWDNPMLRKAIIARAKELVAQK